jgi:hypothetical protein
VNGLGRVRISALRTWATVLLFIVLPVAALAAIAYRGYYDNWFWQGHPAQLHWCGSSYHRAPPAVDGATARSRGRLYGVGHAPPLVGQEMLTDTPPDAVQRHRDADEVCSLGLVLRIGDGRYLPYELMGGP